jgi:hypothetical protein
MPQRRHSASQDLGGALLLLVSDAGHHMKGIAITFDGGYPLSRL